MSGTHQPEPSEVVYLVEHYVEKALSDAEKYDNSSLFDTSGVHSLHRLVAQVYALGHEAGEQAANARHHFDNVRTKR